MVRKSDGLTPRQRQSRRIMREKSARKKRRALLRKTQIAFGVLVIVFGAGGGFWVWKTGMIGHTVQTVSNGMYNLTARAGFSLDSLYLEGRSRTPMTDIQKALALKKGDPILQLSLRDMRDQLERIGSIRFAAVERELPNKLIIRIIERDPVAVWQHQGKLALVDDNGVVMNDVKVDVYRGLPLIVGSGAPAGAMELLALLATEPALSRRFAAAVRVGGRRWNIRLQNGIEIKLPETNPGEAWKSLAKLQEKQQLLDRDVKVIDLRVGGRLFITLSPQDAPGKSADAKET